MDVSKVNNGELVELYSSCIKELKSRKIIRTKNVLGELGEYIAIDFYNKTSGLPKLQTAPIGTQNVDAISRNGERYSIKSCTTNTTGTFFGLEPLGSTKPDRQAFEYLIICKFDDDFKLSAIYELSWDKFLIHKKWQSRMKAWYVTITNDTINDAKIIYRS